MPLVYTVGRGNQTIDDLIATLTATGITRLVDVRSYPRFRRYPHFGYGPMGTSLAAAADVLTQAGRRACFSRRR